MDAKILPVCLLYNVVTIGCGNDVSRGGKGTRQKAARHAFTGQQLYITDGVLIVALDVGESCISSNS